MRALFTSSQYLFPSFFFKLGDCHAIYEASLEKRGRFLLTHKAFDHIKLFITMAQCNDCAVHSRDLVCRVIIDRGKHRYASRISFPRVREDAHAHARFLMLIHQDEKCVPCHFLARFHSLISPVRRFSRLS